MVSLPSRPNLGPERSIWIKQPLSILPPTRTLSSAIVIARYAHAMVLSRPIVDNQRPRSRSLSLASRCRKNNDPQNESIQLTLFMLVLMSKPSTKAVPPDMVSSPVNIRNVVVFPAPLIPRRPKHSLKGIPRLKRSTATNGPRPGNQTQDIDVYITF